MLAIHRQVTDVDKYSLDHRALKGKWNPTQWLSWRVTFENGYLNALMANNNNEKASMDARRRGMRVTAALHTLRTLKEQSYFLTSSEMVQLSPSNPGASVFHTLPDLPRKPTRFPCTMVQVCPAHRTDMGAKGLPFRERRTGRVPGGAGGSGICAVLGLP